MKTSAVVFMRYHQEFAVCPILPSIAVMETRMKSNLGLKRFMCLMLSNFLITVHHWIRTSSRTRNWKLELKQKQYLLVCYCKWFARPTFLSIPGSTREIVFPTVGAALWHQSLIKKLAHQLDYRSILGRHILNFSWQMTLPCVKLA